MSRRPTAARQQTVFLRARKPPPPTATESRGAYERRDEHALATGSRVTHGTAAVAVRLPSKIVRAIRGPITGCRPASDPLVRPPQVSCIEKPCRRFPLKRRAVKLNVIISNRRSIILFNCDASLAVCRKN